MPTEVNSSTEAKEARRRPYAPPEVLSRETIEAMASVCSPTPTYKGSPVQCSRSNS